MSFKDKVIIVTGASSGIGAATAVAYAKQGAKLVLGGRDEEKLKKTVKLCEEQCIGKENLLTVLGDLEYEEVCNGLVDKAVQRFGHLDILVNNAGSLASGNSEKCTIRDMDNMYSVHVRSVFMITKRAMPHLQKSKGNVVNVSSGSSVMSRPVLLAYSTAKAAQNQFTKWLGQEVDPCGVRVNSIMPGLIDTDIFIRPGGMIEGGTQQEKAEFIEASAKTHALDRVGHVEEVSKVILFVSSEAASFMTGAAILVDGGRSGKSGLP